MEISKQLRKDVAEKGDELKKFDNIILEFMDGRVYRGALDWFNDGPFQKLEEEAQAKIIASLEGFAYNEPDKLADNTAELVNASIDIPGVSEEDEDVIFGNLTRTLFHFVGKYTA